LKTVLTLFEDYLKLSQHANFESIIPALSENTPNRISDIIVSHLYLPLEEKQNFLETLNSLERIQRLKYVLENEIFRIHSKLKKEGKKPRRRGPIGEPGQKIFPSGMNFRKDDQPNEIAEMKEKLAKAKMPKDAEEKAKK